MRDRSSACFAERLEPLGRILDFTEQQYVVWSCAPIYGPNDKIHVFFTRVPGPRNEWFKNFRMKGEIVHATADRPEGPYSVHEVVHKGRGEGFWDAYGIVNPRIYKTGNGYALFFTAYEIPWPREKMKEHIGLLVSDDLQNWSCANDGQPILSPDLVTSNAWDSQIVNNAAFIKNPTNNQCWLYYRGLKDLSMYNIGLAISDKIEGPYTRSNCNPVIDTSKLKNNFKGFEDPHVWFEKDSFRMIVQDTGYFKNPGGCYFESEDGIYWSKPMRGYFGPEYYWNEKGNLDSPLILLGETGEPEYLFVNRFTNGRATGFVFRINK